MTELCADAYVKRCGQQTCSLSESQQHPCSCNASACELKKKRRRKNERTLDSKLGCFCVYACKCKIVGECLWLSPDAPLWCVNHSVHVCKPTRLSGSLKHRGWTHEHRPWFMARLLYDAI